MPRRTTKPLAALLEEQGIAVNQPPADEALPPVLLNGAAFKFPAPPARPKPSPGPDPLEAELTRLRAENARLKANRYRLAISPKGGLSVYGLGKFPVTLYREQWERVLEGKESILAFIRANDGALKKQS